MIVDVAAIHAATGQKLGNDQDIGQIS